MESLSRIAFRFSAIYFVVYSAYVIPLPLGYLIGPPWSQVWDELLDFVGRAVLGIDDLGFANNGSGDTRVAYIHSLVSLGFAVVGCGIWTWFARERESPRMAAWMLVWARYWLAGFMLTYGIGKVLPMQFAALDLVDLTRSYGDSSPMGLVWRFMGHSPGYTAFGGAAELLGGALLLWRRTNTLGALVCIAVLANVVALNVFYDIPVKLFSSHLLLLALVIAALDGRRLVRVFVLGEAVPATATPPVLPEREHLRRVLKVSYVVALLATLSIFFIIPHYQTPSPTPTWVGVYETIGDQVECAPRVECTREQRVPVDRIVFGESGRIVIDFEVGPSIYANLDEQTQLLTLWSSEHESPVWTVEQHEDGTLVVEGTLGVARHKATLQPVDAPLLLREWDFHWISEGPVNL